jgi:hypothetical protein
MNTQWTRSGWFVISLAALVGCQTAPQTASFQCGAGAAAATYLICKATGRSDRDCVAAGVALGVGGAAICYTYASNLDKRKQQLAGQENNLDARIRYVRGLNEDSQQLNTELSKQVAATAQSTDALVAQIQQRKVSNERLAQEREARDNEVKAASAQVAKGNEALREVKAYRAQSKPASTELDASIARQEQLLAEAQRQVDLLAAQRARVT